MEKFFLIHEESDKEKFINKHIDEASKFIVNDRRFDELTSDEVGMIHLKHGTLIPSLKELISLFKDKPDKIINIEIKGYNSRFNTVDIIKQSIAERIIKEEQFIISSFDHRELVKVRNDMPNVKIGMLFSDCAYDAKLMYPWVDGSKAVYQPINNETINLPVFEKINPDFIIISHSSAIDNTFELIRAKSDKLKIVIWTYTELDNYDDVEFKKIINDNKDIIEAVIVDNPKGFSF